MNYIEELCSFKNIGKKGEKDFLIEYYKKINNPQNKLKVIHITGTAGKGSSSMMIANALQEAGFKVGLLTSPHLFKLNERIKINGKNISDLDLDNYIKEFFNQVPNATFSEYLTLIAVKYFLDNNIDYFVCEAFVGGKFDSTNIFNSIATVITSIGLDHQNLLGNTKEEILKNKLGILRKDIPLFTRIDNKIIREEVKKIGAKHIKVKRLVETNLIGTFQKENAGIAYEVLKYLNIDENIIRESLKNVLWNGRI
ncbi:bifunctional folylpolyglutamate synthase/dihydrofolate synthase, partial [bacterium]|nr:bifunctional folylpolyglutamate synthase/dihydrofolate synthase [bacterium]